jgi:hypothetical protein
MTSSSIFSMRAFHIGSSFVLGLILFSGTLFAQKASYGQQVAVMKVLKPDLKIIGVLGSNLSDKNVQDLTRAGMAQGVTVVIAKPKDPREVGALYKRLVSDKKIQILWLPDGSDEVMMGISIDFLTENTAMDRVGLCVTEKKLVASGVLCSILTENGKLVVYVNKKIASVIGVAVPGEGSEINFVSQ